MPSEVLLARVLLELAHSTETDRWSSLHAQGLVPDHWPYGLDRLAHHGVEPVAPPGPQGGARARVNAALRKVGRFQWGEQFRRVPSDIDMRLAWSEGAGVPACLRGGCPVVSGVIWLTERSRTASPATRLAATALGRAAAVFTLSDAQIPVLRDEFGLKGSKLNHLSFGIDHEFFVPGGEAEPGHVVSVGNDKHRDFDTLGAALADVGRRHPAHRATIVTRRELTWARGTTTWIREMNHRDLVGVYQRASVVALAMTSNLHVSGITAALEAMACARPVVVSDTPGMRHYVRHGETGLLVPPGDRDALAEAVHSLLADPARATAMGEEARRAVEARFNTEHQAAALAEILLSVRR